MAKKIGVVCLVILAALTALTVSYSSWGQTLEVPSAEVSIAAAPEVVSDAATNITNTSARLNGHLSSLAPGGAPVAVYFEYGTTAAYGTTKAANPNSASVVGSPGQFIRNITGLTTGQTYHFRAKGVGYFTVYGEDLSFVAVKPFAVTTNAASGISKVSGGTYKATLNGTLSALGLEDDAALSFEWGTSLSYGNTVVGSPASWGGNVPKSFTGSIPSGLIDNVTYHFRAKAVGSGAVVYGSDKTFKP